VFEAARDPAVPRLVGQSHNKSDSSDFSAPMKPRRVEHSIFETKRSIARVPQFERTGVSFETNIGFIDVGCLDLRFGGDGAETG
jgi:hypothetical protein